MERLLDGLSSQPCSDHGRLVRQNLALSNLHGEFHRLRTAEVSKNFEGLQYCRLLLRGSNDGIAHWCIACRTSWQEGDIPVGLILSGQRSCSLIHKEWPRAIALVPLATTLITVLSGMFRRGP